MTSYPAELPIRDALRRYFEDNGFGRDGGYADAWVDLKIGPVPVPFPNTNARRRAVRFHDLHHIATEYRTDLAGEFEISAWEVASGCRDFVAAWQLNLAGLFAGLLVWPRRTFRAFVRGRHTRNFYGREYEPLLGLTVGAARANLGTDAPIPRPTFGDVVALVAAAVAGAAVGALSLVTLVPLGLVAAPFLRLAARRARASSVREPAR